jgi:hypothetical protein
MSINRSAPFLPPSTYKLATIITQGVTNGSCFLKGINISPCAHAFGAAEKDESRSQVSVQALPEIFRDWRK